MRREMLLVNTPIFSSSENSGGKEVRGPTSLPANPAGAVLQGPRAGKPQQESETGQNERIKRGEILNTLSIHSDTLLYIENV